MVRNKVRTQVLEAWRKSFGPGPTCPPGPKFVRTAPKYQKKIAKNYCKAAQLRSSCTYVRSMTLDTRVCATNSSSPPTWKCRSTLIATASAFFQFTISRNVRQSLSGDGSISEEGAVGLSCVLHRNRGGRLYVFVGWHE